jgi:hypothetical protein
MPVKTMNETYIEVTIRTFGDESRKVMVSETFTEDPVTSDMLEDVFNDALRGAGYYPRGE